MGSFVNFPYCYAFTPLCCSFCTLVVSHTGGGMDPPEFFLRIAESWLKDPNSPTEWLVCLNKNENETKAASAISNVTKIRCCLGLLLWGKKTQRLDVRFHGSSRSAILRRILTSSNNNFSSSHLIKPLCPASFAHLFADMLPFISLAKSQDIHIFGTAILPHGLPCSA